MTTIEYRVRPVTRYVVTRHETTGSTGTSSRFLGEHESEELAYKIACALAREAAYNLGCAPGDERVRYPDPPSERGTPLEL